MENMTKVDTMVVVKKFKWKYNTWLEERTIDGRKKLSNGIQNSVIWRKEGRREDG